MIRRLRSLLTRRPRQSRLSMLEAAWSHPSIAAGTRLAEAEVTQLRGYQIRAARQQQQRSDVDASVTAIEDAAQRREGRAEQ